MTPPVVLCIGGSDSSGGGGIQGDLKSLCAHRVWGMSVITAVTAQNTREINDMYALPGNVVASQLGALLEDMPPAATKTGMLASAEVVGVITGRARAGALPNLVVDPVLLASGGSRMGVTAAIERLLPYATVATPSIDEASALVGWQVSSPADMAGAASQLASGGPKYVVITGGQLSGLDEAVDAVWIDTAVRFLRAPRVQTRNDQGTGAAFATAIAARLALGDPVPEALTGAKQFVTRALAGARSWQLGAGRGGIDHFGWTAADQFIRERG